MLITVVGLGYVGLPVSLLLAKAGHTVNGFDTSQVTIDKLISCIPSIVEPGIQDLLTEVIQKGSFRPSSVIQSADAYVICVPTPFTSSKTPDLSYVFSAIDSIIPYLKNQDILILESTIPVGTTESVESYTG